MPKHIKDAIAFFKIFSLKVRTAPLERTKDAIAFNMEIIYLRKNFVNIFPANFKKTCRFRKTLRFFVDKMQEIEYYTCG